MTAGRGPKGDAGRKSLWQHGLSGGYVGVLLALVALTLVYAAARLNGKQFSPEAWYSTIGLLVMIAGFVVALYFAEGSEIAATALLGLDEEQLDLGPSIAVLRELRRKVDLFVSGRQFIVVALVVLFAGFCDAYANGSPQAPQSWNLAILFTPLVVKLYAFSFPILTSLWLSQLYAKFVAQRRPATFFRSAIVQAVFVRPSIWLGDVLVVGDPSAWLTKLTLRGKADDTRVPSRAKTYEGLATFRDGIGFEDAHIALTIDSRDGSTDVSMRFRVRAYAAGGKLFRQSDEWPAPILEEPAPRLEATRDCTSSGPRFSDQGRKLDWDFTLATPLAAGDDFEFTVRYRVGPGGVSVDPGAADEFFYQEHKYPVKRLAVSVRFTDTSACMLSNGGVVADVSDDEETREREGSRFRGTVLAVDGGYDYDVAFPLLGGTYRCRWILERRVPKPAGSQGPLARLRPIQDP